MNLKEIKQLSDDELGYQVAIAAGAKEAVGNKTGNKYFALSYDYTNPIYFSTDLNTIAELEKIVIEKVGGFDYVSHLLDVLGVGELTHLESAFVGEPSDSYPKLRKQSFSVGHTTQILRACRFLRACRLCATATARQRAEACLLSLHTVQNQNNVKN